MTFIFFASGFAGLIYESIWTHYLKLFLGHAAYAQTLVLGIFMGGMAVGAALAARYSARIRNPLLLYAAIELGIGLFAAVFHPVFTAATDGFYDLALAQQLGGTAFLVAKWSLAALLILPQSILLGATFPVFAAAATRTTRSAGRMIATLYFANSIGGALGVLASGFVLIPALGLPGTMLAAGGVNLVIAALVAWMSATIARPTADVLARTPQQGQVRDPGEARFGPIARLLVAVSFFTGASSFIYEVGWIRMLSLVLGSATHSFELMLCAFIVGLALGGLWIRGRIDTASSPGVLLGYVQIAMGCAAVATLPLYSATFDLTAWVINNVSKTQEGYTLLNLVRYGISSLIMFPAAFCAGMTLPLATRILHSNEGQGEKAIGVIYSANTLGAIAGIAFAVHVGFPVLGLNSLIAFGAVIDVLLGIALLVAFAGRKRVAHGLAAMTACLGTAAAAATTFDPQKLVSGVFRTGRAQVNGKVIEVAHGRTATISVEHDGPIVAIRTNGKSDASALVGAPPGYTLDEITMTLIGSIPLMLHDDPKRVANIGFGSGMTGEVILADPRVQRLDTVEIEPRMVDLARHFKHLNRRIYEDPRSAIHIDDAKSFFASHGQTYDVIVSEPSNPWVSGVAGLFSVEFYRHVSRYLTPDGIFAQWIQIYETHPHRVASIIKALDQSFEDYLLVALDSGNVLLVARPHGKVVLRADAFSRLSRDMAGKLRRLSVGNQSDIAMRMIGSKALFRPWLDAQEVPANSDFAPYLDTHADYDRFIGAGWGELAAIPLSPFPIAEVLGQRAPFPAGALLSMNRHFGDQPQALAARIARRTLLGDEGALASLPLPDAVPEALMRQATQVLGDCRNPPVDDKPYALAGIAIKVLPHLPPADGAAMLDAAQGLACFDALPAEQAGWRDLLRHVANRNAAGIGASAEALLDGGQGATEVRLQYLLGMAVLGHLGAGDRARARATWDRHAPAVAGKPLSLSMELLRAQVLSTGK